MIIFGYTLIFCIIGYLFGSMIFGQFLAWAKKKDLTIVGSTNPGATNVKREFGMGWAFFVSCLDAIKGMLAIFVCYGIYIIAIYKAGYHNPNLYCLVYLTGVFACLGHCFPIQYVLCLIFNKGNKDKARKYKGGKGVSTTGGVLFAVSPYLGLIAFLIWLLVVLITRYVSIGSLLCMTIASLFVLIPPVGNFYLFNANGGFPWLDTSSMGESYQNYPWLMIGTLIILMCNNIILTCKHRPNIIKLISHQESKLF